MAGFTTSRPARVASVVVALVLLGGGLATHLPPDVALWVASSSDFLGVGLALVGIGWLVDDAAATVLGVVLLPLVLMLLMPLTLYIAMGAKQFGDPALALALFFGMWGLRPARRVRALAPEHRLRAV
jgi:hypothetical protein